MLQFVKGGDSMNNVYNLRKQRNMTQDEFAEFCNVSRISIARYEAGADVSRSNAQRIAEACHVSLSFVLGIEQTEDEDVWMIRERLRSDPDFRILFSAAEKATPDHLRAAAAMLKSLETPVWPDEETEPQEFPE
jgi:transcriptional regulator with XRE-family HTH domain